MDFQTHDVQQTKMMISLSWCKGHLDDMTFSPSLNPTEVVIPWCFLPCSCSTSKIGQFLSQNFCVIWSIDTHMHNEVCLNLSFPAHQSGRIQIGHLVLAGHGPMFLGPKKTQHQGETAIHRFNRWESGVWIWWRPRTFQCFGGILPSNVERLGEIWSSWFKVIYIYNWLAEMDLRECALQLTMANVPSCSEKWAPCFPFCGSTSTSHTCSAWMAKL